jgi:hypothetical protein
MLVVFNLFLVKYNSQLKTEIYFCIQNKKIVYFSKKYPKKRYDGICYVKELTHEKYKEYKKHLN